MPFSATDIQNLGIGIVALIVLFLTVKLFVQVLDRNSSAYEKLADTLEKQNEREMKFQREVLDLLNDTNRKVSDIHKRGQPA